MMGSFAALHDTPFLNKKSKHNLTGVPMANYFNTLNLRNQLAQLGKCRFMARDEFADGASFLKGK